MEPIYRTGNETVDRLSRLQITGNVIPAAWYRTIRRETGKPYLNAIVILSDIVYWYRAAEIRDEGSGQLLGYRKRFRADLLQRSYQQMADQFGISKRDATNAVVALEKLGVVTRVFRTLELNGQTVPNVLFLALHVDVLERLTFPEENREIEIEMGDAKDAGSGKVSERDCLRSEKNAQMPDRGCHLFGGDIPRKEGRGITEISDTLNRYEREGLTEMGETNTENTYKDYSTDYPILSYQDAKERFECQIEYDVLKQGLTDTEELDEVVEIAVEILTSSAEMIRVNREEKPAALVKAQYRRLNMFHIQYVMGCLGNTNTRAKNIRAVIVTALYNSVNTIGNYYGNLYRYHSGKEREEVDSS